MLVFKAEDLIPVINEARKNKSNICLGKDQGVYMFSWTCDRDEKNSPKHMAYAQGCNPNIDDFDDWWELSREELGGDDFGMNLNAHNQIFSGVLEHNFDLTVKANGDLLEFKCKPPSRLIKK